jgi:hypothetical protein
MAGAIEGLGGAMALVRCVVGFRRALERVDRDASAVDPRNAQRRVIRWSIRIARCPIKATPGLGASIDVETESASEDLTARSNPGAADAEPIKNVATDINKVVLKTSIAFTSRSARSLILSRISHSREGRLPHLQIGVRNGGTPQA